MNSTFRTQSKHGHSVKFSPYVSDRLACVSSQNYGIAGCGCLYILSISSNPANQITLLRALEWNNCLFDVTWAENNENILVTAGGDGSIQVWDVTQEQGLVKVFKEHTKEVNAVEWSQTRNEQFVLSCSWDSTVKLWDISQERSLLTFSGHNSIVYSVSWAPHRPGVFASSSGDHSILVWESKNPKNCLALRSAHEEEILSCDWCKYSENIVFSGTAGGSIVGWDVRNPMNPICHIQGHKYSVRRIKACPFTGSVVASASYDFTVKLWNVQKQQCLETIKHHTEFVCGLDFNLHIPGQIADCAWDELIHVYDTNNSFYC